MRYLVRAVSIVAGLALAGQAAAAAPAPSDITGHWREAAGSCDSPYLEAVERTAGPKGEAAVVGVVRSGAVTVRGVIPLAGSRKGRLIDGATGKPVLQLIAVRDGKLKVSVGGKSGGLTTTTLEFCDGSRPDYAAGDAMRAALPGAWYEVSASGFKVLGRQAAGVAGCAVAPDDNGQRGDLAIAQVDGALRWSARGEDGAHGDWAATDAAPVAFLGKTWLRTTIGPEGASRFVSLAPAPGSTQQRLMVADPQTRKFRYFNACPG